MCLAMLFRTVIEALQAFCFEAEARQQPCHGPVCFPRARRDARACQPLGRVPEDVGEDIADRAPSDDALAVKRHVAICAVVAVDDQAAHKEAVFVDSPDRAKWRHRPALEMTINPFGYFGIVIMNKADFQRMAPVV